MQPSFFTSMLIVAGAAAALPTVPTNSTWNFNSTVGMTVKTTSGVIIGHANDRYTSVSEYLSIPFAKPPVNDLRFAPPQAYTSDCTIIADQQPLSCPQAPSTINYSQPLNWQHISVAHGGFANHTSEDCLHLNVWTKYPAPGANVKPVMIWIYGGGFHSGGASDSSEQGAIFAEEQDVVLVNFNYRLGILGFSGAPGLTQNVGLLDQRLAVEWVRDNIAAFGGDPTRITLFGHSAGSASVDYYNYAWMDDPIIAGSIIMSGTASGFGNRLPNTTASAWSETAAALGCSSGSDSTVAACMRNKTTEEVFSASQNVSKTFPSQLNSAGKLYSSITGVFGPTVDNQTVFENYTTLADAGKFIQKPVIVGSNSDEGCFFTEKGQITTADDPLVTEVVFTCPTYHAAVSRTQAGLPSWKYRYYGAYPNMYADACPGQPWHGQEVNVLFGSSRIASGENATKKENEEGWYLRQAWAAFAHDPAKGLLEEMGWPELSASPNSSIALGLNNTLLLDEDASAYSRPCLTKLASSASNF